MNIQEIKNTLSNKMCRPDVQHIMRDILLARFKEIIRNSKFVKLDLPEHYIVKKGNPERKFVYFNLETTGIYIYTLRVIAINPSFQSTFNIRINIDIFKEDPCPNLAIEVYP